MRHVDIEGAEVVTKSTLLGPPEQDIPGFPGLPAGHKRKRLLPVTRSHGKQPCFGRTFAGSVHPAEVQDQFGVAVGLEDKLPLRSV